MQQPIASVTHPDEDALFVNCPACGAPDAHLRIGRSEGREAVVIMFSCLNEWDPGHGTPSDRELLECHARSPLAAVERRRVPWWLQN
jgi:hypothetical protein